MNQRIVYISVESSVIQIEGSLYPVDKICGVKIVEIAPSKEEINALDSELFLLNLIYLISSILDLIIWLVTLLRVPSSLRANIKAKIDKLERYRRIVFQRHGIIVKMQGESYFLLVASNEKHNIDDLFLKIKTAISSQGQGNFSYNQSITLHGDITNQSGNFGVGFNTGRVNLEAN
jgi:hypothetical protein